MDSPLLREYCAGIHPLTLVRDPLPMNIVDQIIQQLGVSKEQAEGGLGLIVKLAKEKLGADFSQVSNVIPEANHLVNTAPAEEGKSALGGLLGALAEKVGLGDLGSLADLAASFQKLGLDMDKLQAFVKTVLAFVESKGGTVVKDLLNKVLTK